MLGSDPGPVLLGLWRKSEAALPYNEEDIVETIKSSNDDIADRFKSTSEGEINLNFPLNLALVYMSCSLPLHSVLPLMGLLLHHPCRRSVQLIPSGDIHLLILPLHARPMMLLQGPEEGPQST
jgi:hypothetical protein